MGSPKGMALRRGARRGAGEELRSPSLLVACPNKSDNNNNNLDDEDSDDEGAPEAHTISTTLLRKSEKDALEGRLQLMHVPRVGRISRP